MIGKIAFATEGGRNVEAVLGSDGRWTCAFADIADQLNFAFDPADRRFVYPACGPFGAMAVTEAAAYYGGACELEKSKNGGAGVIY